MTYKKWYHILIRELKKAYSKSPEFAKSHGIDHILRVWKNVEKLGKKLKADMEISIAATLLHDLGRHYPGAEGIHGPKGAKLAKPILLKIRFPKKKIPCVLEAIANHDFQTPKSKRKSKESKILYDADKMDVLSKTGIARAFMFFPNKGKDLKWIAHEFTKKDNRLVGRYKGLHFDESRKIVKKDYKYVINYFKELKKELK